eukprot:scaffold36145_cov69-Phaeocystis_antarctica.AAC.3
MRCVSLARRAVSARYVRALAIMGVSKSSAMRMWPFRGQASSSRPSSPCPWASSPRAWCICSSCPCPPRVPRPAPELGLRSRQPPAAGSPAPAPARSRQLQSAVQQAEQPHVLAAALPVAVRSSRALTEDRRARRSARPSGSSGRPRRSPARCARGCPVQGHVRWRAQWRAQCMARRSPSQRAVYMQSMCSAHVECACSAHAA